MAAARCSCSVRPYRWPDGAIHESEKQEIRAVIPNILKRYEELQTGRTAGWTSALELAAITRAILQNTGEIFPCSVILNGEYGHRDLSVSVPVALGKTGVREILSGSLLQMSRRIEAHRRPAEERSRIVDESL